MKRGPNYSRLSLWQNRTLMQDGAKMQKMIFALITIKQGFCQQSGHFLVNNIQVIIHHDFHCNSHIVTLGMSGELFQETGCHNGEEQRGKEGRKERKKESIESVTIHVLNDLSKPISKLSPSIRSSSTHPMLYLKSRVRSAAQTATATRPWQQHV